MTHASDLGYQLKAAKPSLPASVYYDPDRYKEELNTIWFKNWLYACRAETLSEPRSFQTIMVGEQSILLLRTKEGEIKAYHNVCRHRGSRLVEETSGILPANRITCPYHAWSYGLDGDLKAISSHNCPANFDKGDFGLKSIAVANWHGFIFINLAGEAAGPLEDAFDKDSADLSNWPLADLKVGHRLQKTMACNWKIFWENFNECLHCPGVHKNLVKMVPIYGRKLMDPKDLDDWQDNIESEDPRLSGGMKKGAKTWSTTGAPVAPEFPNLSERERKIAFNYAMMLPTVFIVGHVDYVRIVRLMPTGPETTEITVEWLFAPDALTDPDVDISPAIDFAVEVVMEDAYVSELNQKGINSIGFEQGVLMPEEYAVHDFQNWVRAQMNE